MLRELKKSEAKSVASIKNGEYVKIIGRALKVNEVLIAPLSKKECIFYQIEVIHQKDKNSKTIIDETRTSDFFVSVKNEMVLIKMDQSHQDYTVILNYDHLDNSGTFNDAKPHLDHYLRSKGFESTGLFGFNKSLKYKEGIIEHSEKVAVKGIAEWRALKEPIEGYHYSKILTLRGSKNQKLIITDLAEAKYQDHS
ncbi:MAG: hypothetical protein K0U54_02045 [Bacteroidetes bacterium]|nr:hypothetical protein [Bacteroidota bacterium]